MTTIISNTLRVLTFQIASEAERRLYVFQHAKREWFWHQKGPHGIMTGCVDDDPTRIWQAINGDYCWQRECRSAAGVTRAAGSEGFKGSTKTLEEAMRAAIEATHNLRSEIDKYLEQPSLIACNVSNVSTVT